MGLLSWLDPIIKVGSSLLNHHSQQSTNRQNAQMQREQLGWEERMSNTAIQRRADDIEAAGGNRALAFTNGQEASTPVLAPAKNEAPQLDGEAGFTAARIGKEQVANLKANTAAQIAAAQKTGADTDLSRALASKARVEQLAILSTARQTDANVGLIDQQKQEILQRIKNLVSEQKLRDLEIKLKNKTLEDAAKIIANNAKSGDLGMQGKENQSKIEAVIGDVLFDNRRRATVPGAKPMQLLRGGRREWKPRSHQ